MAQVQEERLRERKGLRLRIALLLLLLALLLLIACVALRYIQTREPLPEVVGAEAIARTTPPHYLFSFYGVDQPFGIAISPDGERLYVTEMGGGRWIKVFDRNGELVDRWAPPGTNPAQRAPTYVAVEPSTGRVFVADRMARAIHIFLPDGTYQDRIIWPEATVRTWIKMWVGEVAVQPGWVYTYTYGSGHVLIQAPPADEEQLQSWSAQLKPPYRIVTKTRLIDPPLREPDLTGWAPMGVAFDPATEDLLVSTVAPHGLRRFTFAYGVRTPKDFAWERAEVWAVGRKGTAPGEFDFPNGVAVDSQGRIYVADGNNGRVQAFDPEGNLLYAFSGGAGLGGMNLPRGVAVDDLDRLYVVDAVGQMVRVFDVSGEAPKFLFNFGTMGLGKGEFNFPNDLVLDATGRLYITDRANNRIQVWSY